MTTEQIKAWYKDWCKRNKKNGGVLVGSSIEKLLTDFAATNEPVTIAQQLFGDSKSLPAAETEILNTAFKKSQSKL